jgi:hypothetical protein
MGTATCKVSDMTCSESIIDSGATIVPTAFERIQRRTPNTGTAHSVNIPKWPNVPLFDRAGAPP